VQHIVTGRFKARTITTRQEKILDAGGMNIFPIFLGYKA
jgi:hypothetical protein